MTMMMTVVLKIGVVGISNSDDVCCLALACSELFGLPA